MKKVLIIGGNGFVGGHLVMGAIERGYEPAIADTGDTPGIPDILYFKCDIMDYENILKVMESFRPNFVINVAAVADIDRAEKNRGLAEGVNVTGAANAARAAAWVHAKYCWFSSDAVFNGKGTGYDENSPPEPVNYYGRTKEMGEKAVLEANPDAIVPRISLVLGFPIKEGNSFLAGLYAKLTSGQHVVGYTYEIRTPVDVLTLCQAIYELCEMDFRGVLHIGSTASISRYELTRMLAEKLGLDPVMVSPSDEVDTTRTPRHRNGIISIHKAQEVLKNTKMLSVEETVDRALTTLRKEGTGH